MFIHIAMNSVFGAYGTPEERAVNFSWLALGFSISNSIGPLVAGFAIDRLGHAAGDADARRFSGPRRRAAVADASGRCRGRSRWRTRKRAGVLDLLRIPQLRNTFIVSLLLAMGWDLYTFLIPLYGARLGLAATTIGIIMSTFAVATFAVRPRHAARW